MNNLDIKKQLSLFRKAFWTASDPQRAAFEKRYLKSPLKFYGVTVPFIEGMARDYRKSNGDMPSEQVFALAEALWASEYHQERTLAIRILGQYRDRLILASMPMLERMLAESTGWDHVDGISNHLVDAVLRKDRRAFRYLKRWARSENFWMRRASLISQILLFREGRGDRDLFFALAESMIGEKEFFIRKAIGWTVRELSKADPDAAFGFLMKVRERASGLTLREGAKRLPGEMRAKVLEK